MLGIRKHMNKYRSKLLIATQLCSITLLTLFFAASANAQMIATEKTTITVPPVPDDVKVETGNEAFLVGHGVGTQNYSCQPCDPTKPNCPNGVAFTLFTPQATLFNDQGEQLITHFFSLNPFEPGVIRVTWESSRDTSTIWAKATGSSTDSHFVNLGAVAWLRLQVVGALAGPTGGDKLVKTTFVQRLNTVGGLAPSTGCSSSADLGNKAFVPYTADYFFYKAADGSN
jgi:Protein of unknown function (DUF3455)